MAYCSGVPINHPGRRPCPVQVLPELGSRYLAAPAPVFPFGVLLPLGERPVARELLSDAFELALGDADLAARCFFGVLAAGSAVACIGFLPRLAFPSILFSALSAGILPCWPWYAPRNAVLELPTTLICSSAFSSSDRLCCTNKVKAEFGFLPAELWHRDRNRRAKTRKAI